MLKCANVLWETGYVKKQYICCKFLLINLLYITTLSQQCHEPYFQEGGYDGHVIGYEVDLVERANMLNNSTGL